MSRIALVTGGNRGIGYETCRQLAAMGMRVILASRRQDAGESAAHALNAENYDVTPYHLDVTDPSSVYECQVWVQKHYGQLDVLVNNAGVYPDEGVSIFDVTFETVQKAMSVNAYGPFLMCKAFVPMMREQDYGRVVNVSTGYASITQMGGYTGAYKMSKVAQNALTRIVAQEVRTYNIKVNAADPGWVATDMGGLAAPRNVEQGADTIVWLATLPDDGPTNSFFYDRELRTW